ncbi:hypothetical protein UFOVP133_58 [uncultured Caudovirales phage]|uniref:Uncharacterized protein n=1 Tax=uncultured Caudovirales phage TaxID=2100421 RepID=A0A6J5LA40_9CAUD|nr:hypothetical protein UFOVP133_58 [uncultured Caudovirales phage]
MKYIYFAIGLAIGCLAACQDRYRYSCQDPDHFTDVECQKPKCLFTQTCPEYLVAPILEKQIEQPKPPAPTEANR